MCLKIAKVTAQARHKQSREAALEEMSLQTSEKSRQRGCSCYVVIWDPPTGRVHQQGTRVLLHVSTCIQGQQAWSQFAQPPWASATDGGAEWCGRTSTKKTPVGQPSSSPTVAASANTVGFWISFSVSYHMTSQNVDITGLSKGHISLLLDTRVTWSGVLVVLCVLCMLIWPWPNPRSRSRGDDHVTRRGNLWFLLVQVSKWKETDCIQFLVFLKYHTR